MTVQTAMYVTDGELERHSSCDCADIGLKKLDEGTCNSVFQVGGIALGWAGFKEF